MLDLLIKNGFIVDGTGNLGFYASVGVTDNTVKIIRGDVSSISATETLDASGLIVCPGFIDMHAHSGMVVLDKPLHEPKITQGITTELIGIDGCSYAPFLSKDDLTAFRVLNAGLDGNPELQQEWSSVSEYLGHLDNKVSCNFAYVMGNSALRISAMGWDNRAPTTDEMKKMKYLIHQGMEEGAVGISTGLDYPPGSYASTEELIELSKEVNKLGGFYATHVRYALGDKFLDPFREAIEISNKSGVPLHISHFFHRLPSRGPFAKQIELIDEALSEGTDLTFDSYPYIYGSTRLIILMPQWAQEGGPTSLLERLKSPDERQRIVKELKPRAPTWNDMWITHLHDHDNIKWDGWSLGEIADATGKDPADVVCDILIEENLATNYVAAGGNQMSIADFYRHPAAMIGSDAVLLGEHPSPRTYGTFPIILDVFVRQNAHLELREAIRKMSSFPAQRLGLKDRGILRDGMKADIVVFDPEKVHAPATLKDPKQFAEGIHHVFVNGVQVIKNGSHTGAVPGRVVH